MATQEWRVDGCVDGGSGLSVCMESPTRLRRFRFGVALSTGDWSFFLALPVSFLGTIGALCLDPFIHLLAAFLDIGQGDNVVPFEARARFMPADFHGALF